jgi:hypothetical protein
VGEALLVSGAPEAQGHRAGVAVKIKNCGSCGAPIFWAATTNNKLMPVDAEPSDDGNIQIVARDRGGTPYVVVHSQPPMHAETLYFSHFVTCPDAENTSDWCGCNLRLPRVIKRDGRKV